jgi:hypothetical protein
MIKRKPSIDVDAAKEKWAVNNKAAQYEFLRQWIKKNPDAPIQKFQEAWDVLQERSMAGIAIRDTEKLDSLLKQERKLRKDAQSYCRRHKLQPNAIELFLMTDVGYAFRITTGDPTRIYLAVSPDERTFYSNFRRALREAKLKWHHQIEHKPWLLEYIEGSTRKPRLLSEDAYRYIEDHLPVLPYNRLSISHTESITVTDEETGESFTIEVEDSLNHEYPWDSRYAQTARIELCKLMMEGKFDIIDKALDAEDIPEDIKQDMEAEASEDE